MGIDIARPPEVIWPYLVDWENLGRWMLEGEGFRVIGDRREGVGTEAEASIRVGGIRTTDRVEVTRWEPPCILEIRHHGWVSGLGYMELGPAEEGSHLFWRETLRPPYGILGRIGLRFFSRPMRRIFKRDLEVLKDLVETET
jgi:uncharacterized membrane protein